MLSVYAILQPDGRIQLPPELAPDKPAAVLVTILEPLPEVVAPPHPADDTPPGVSNKGHV